VSLKKLIITRLGVKPRISMGGLGVLDVFVDGKRVFSYREAGHMPEDQEILDLIQAQVKASLELLSE
jgi:hypothetical protein